MKELYLLLVALLLVVSARASHFQPFRPGVLQQYTEVGSDTTLAWQADTAGVFQEQLGVDRAGLCPLMRFASTPFGHRIGTVSPGTPQAEYYFEYKSWQQFWLRPGRPVGQVWPVYGALTGQVTSRSLGTVLGQSDSLVTILLSSGHTYVLSRNHGLVSGPAPFDLLWGRSRLRQLTLSAMPGLGLGTPLLGARAIYDFQPGDVFYYAYSSMNLASGPSPTRYEYGDSILTRRAVGSALVYSVWRGGSTYTLTVADSLMPELLNSTNGYLPAQQKWVREISRHPGMFNGQPRLRITERHWLCPSDSLAVTPTIIDSEKYRWFCVGLGMVEDYEANMIYPYYSTSLVGYRKGNVRWGRSFRLAPLAVRAASASSFNATAAPNPFSQELTVRFELTRPQAVAVELRDVLGRVVLAHPAARWPAGAASLSLSTVNLPAGLYTLWLQPADSPTQVLKVLKN